jgi:hypothetical protein
MTEKVTPVRMQDFGVFEATRKVPAAACYLLPPEEGLKTVVEKIQAHGVTVEALTAPLTAEVENFTIDDVHHAERPFQGHREVKLTGKFVRESRTFPGGTLLVRTAQPLGALAAYLLEPESEDGLTAWNFLDAYLSPGKVYPIARVMQAQNVATRILEARNTPEAPGRSGANRRSTEGESQHEE